MADGLHPYFSSGLRWHERLADGLAAARTQNRKVFVAHGHRLCAGTRGLIERTLEKEEVAEIVAKNFVCVAGDHDHLDPELAAVVEKLAKREPTPLCIYLDSDGKLLSS